MAALVAALFPLAAVAGGTLPGFTVKSAKDAGWELYLDPGQTNYGYDFGRYDKSLFVRLSFPKTKCFEEDPEDCRDSKYAIKSGEDFVKIAAKAVKPRMFGPVKETFLGFAKGRVSLFDGMKEGSPIGDFREKDCELGRTREAFPLSYAAGILSFYVEEEEAPLERLFSGTDHEDRELAWEEKHRQCGELRRSTSRIRAVDASTGKPAALTDLFPADKLLAALKSDGAVKRAVPAAELAAATSLDGVVAALKKHGIANADPSAIDSLPRSFVAYDFDGEELSVRITLPLKGEPEALKSPFVQLGLSLAPKPEVLAKLKAEKKHDELRLAVDGRNVLTRSGGRWQSMHGL